MSERIVRDFMTGPMRVFRLWRRLAALTIAVMLGCVGVASAQDKAPAPLLRVVVSNSGKAILESLLDTMTQHVVALGVESDAPRLVGRQRREESAR